MRPPSYNFYKKRLWRWCFPVNFAKFSRTPVDNCSCISAKFSWLLIFFFFFFCGNFFFFIILIKWIFIERLPYILSHWITTLYFFLYLLSYLVTCTYLWAYINLFIYIYSLLNIWIVSLLYYFLITIFSLNPSLETKERKLLVKKHT